MLTMAASPGSRPLEQLKVAELRDELKKRGLSVKGVKKELFERLEEAVKKEEQEGVVHGGNETTREGARKMDALDDTEDVEAEEEISDKLKDEASKSHDTTTACQSNTLQDTSLPTTEELTPFSEGTDALPVVSAPDVVPGSNEERETAGGANVETNNDVLFVDNAVSGNDDAMQLPENVANVADTLEPCKDSIGVESVECENDEKEPAIVISEVADSKSVDVLPGSGFACSVIENVIPDGQDQPIENGDGTVVVDNAVSANDTSGNDCPMHDVENTKDRLSIPDNSNENPSFEADDKSVMQPLTHASDSGVKAEQLERADVEERDLIIKEEKSDVKLEQVVKHEILSEGGLEKSAVKMEPMEVETVVEERHEVMCEAKMESPSDMEDHTQMESRPKELDDLRRSRGKESASRVPDEWKKVKDDDVNVKPVAEDASQARINLKRKDNETDVKQEPAKRMRRWNSGKEVVVDALKPLTTDSMKEIMLPDSAEGSSAASQRLTPKAVATSRPLPPKVKVEPEPSNNTRTVPPSARAPSNSLKVERFVRPFTLKAAKDLVAEFGQCVDFWMDQIKTHCFVTYSSVNEAVAARNGLYGRQWPPSVGSCLIAEFVDANEVKIRSEGLAEKAQPAPAPASMRVSSSMQSPPRVAQSASSMRSNPSALPFPRFSRDAHLLPVPKKDPEPAVVTLEDLFCKTKAKPHIYYLPLTDEQVAEKLKNKQAVR